MIKIHLSPTVIFADDFGISISGAYTGGVTLFRSFDSGATWLEVATFLNPIEGTLRVVKLASYKFTTSNTFVGTVIVVAANNI